MSFDDIDEVSKKDKKDQPEAYKLLLLGKAEDAQSKDWFVAAGKAAVRQGVQLAKLEKEGCHQAHLQALGRVCAAPREDPRQGWREST